MRFWFKALLGILVVAAVIAVIAGLFLGVRHQASTSSSNIDPATLVNNLTVSCMPSLQRWPHTALLLKFSQAVTSAVETIVTAS